jgi:hypothetical protein
VYIRRSAETEAAYLLGHLIRQSNEDWQRRKNLVDGTKLFLLGNMIPALHEDMYLAKLLDVNRNLQGHIRESIFEQSFFITTRFPQLL